ncbi:MAG: NAD(P)/FAD-dependent oxidoreductase [Candidatus Aminicenantes bacterium]|jgi:phytoene dehydrogenase-like protein
MTRKTFLRRDFIKTILAGIPSVTLDWASFPRGKTTHSDGPEFDAIIIGSGLGGLSCAAAFARQGFKALVIEQHHTPGGYSTTFKRPGGFVFDVSLHSTTVGERDGIHNLIPGFPEIEDVEFVPHHDLYRVIYPEHDIRVPMKDLPAYIETLCGHFPEEKKGIAELFKDMQGLLEDINKISTAQGQVDMSNFPKEYPYLFKSFNKTWGDMLDLRIKNPKLKTIISSLWGYYGLPPSKLSSFYYALPTIGYLQEGGYYPKGKSQKISDAFVAFIEERGGKVLLRTRVEEVLLKDQAAHGVRTDDGTTYTAKVVVSNANAYDTFHKMIREQESLKQLYARMEKFSVSLSSFLIFLGLNKDLIGELGIEDTEIFYNRRYDIEADYKACLTADFTDPGFGVTLYDNLYEGYSPPGKNTIGIIVLQGYDHWEKFAGDYWSGNKDEYRKEKERMADILIEKAEETLLPGLSDAIAVKEIGTPLTNIRYTSNTKGAIYGWDQTVDNSGNRRFPNRTPIKNLFLAGAWTSPGHGYGGVIYSGLQCFAEIMKDW